MLAADRTRLIALKRGWVFSRTQVRGLPKVVRSYLGLLAAVTLTAALFDALMKGWSAHQAAFVGLVAGYWLIALAIPQGILLTTQAYVNRGDSITRILSSSAISEQERWARAWLPKRIQVLFSLPLAALGAGVFIAEMLATQVPQGWLARTVSLVTVSVTSALIGLAVHWMIAAVNLVHRWSKCELRLFDPAPARTPGLEDLARVSGATFAAASVYIVILLTPALVWISFDDGSGAPAHLLRSLMILPTAAVLLTSGIAPQATLSGVVRRKRRQELLRLEKALNAKDGKDAADLIPRYLVTAESPTSMIGASNVIQMVVGVLAALLPSALAFLV